MHLHLVSRHACTSRRASDTARELPLSLVVPWVGDTQAVARPLATAVGMVGMVAAVAILHHKEAVDTPPPSPLAEVVMGSLVARMRHRRGIMAPPLVRDLPLGRDRRITEGALRGRRHTHEARSARGKGLCGWREWVSRDDDQVATRCGCLVPVALP